MSQSNGLAAHAERLKAAGRHGDTQLAHLSPAEAAILDWAQGGRSINPETGLPEYFKLKSVLKGVAKAAGALAGAYFGGPAGAAAGAGLTSVLLGDNTKDALATGLLSGLGAYGAQQSGLGDMIGGGLGSGTNLLGQAAESGKGGIDITTASATGGGGKGLSAMLPLLGIAGAAMSGKTKTAKVPKDKPDTSRVPEYEPLDRTQIAYGGDPYSYGQFGPEWQSFDEVNPALQPLAMAAGGQVGRGGGGAAGGHGNTRGNEHDAAMGGSDRGGGGRKSGEPPHARTSGQTAGLANRGSLEGSEGFGAGDRVIDRNVRGAGSFLSQDGTGTLGGIPNKHIQEGISAFDDYKNRSGLWDVLDTLAGPLVNVVKPQWDKIGTYAGGTFHTGTSVPGVIGSIGGAFAGVPLIGGMAGQWAGDKLGIPDVLHGGYDSIPDWAKNNVEGGIHGPQGGTGNADGRTRFHSSPNPNVVKAPLQLPPTAAAPGADGADRPGRAFHPLGDPYSYGQFGPEHQFFTGTIQPDEINMAGGGDVRGPGGGQDDRIPAMLSNGEFVVDAATVAALGGGSTDEGVRRLETMRRNVRKHSRSAAPSSIPPSPKSITAYMRRAA